jgi:hypothetical protein
LTCATLSDYAAPLVHFILDELTMKKFLLYLIPFLICFFENAIAENSRDLQEICQLTIDIGILDDYYHAKELPERKPLLILKNEYVKSEPSLVKFGERVQYASRNELELKGKSRPYLEFSKVVISGGNAYIEFLYPPEGLAGRVNLVKGERGWRIESHDIVER